MNPSSTPTHASTSSDATRLVIKCAGLSKVFRDFWLRSRVRAVDAIDLDVRRGEVFGLLGPNGSGKSTTIKMILGLLHPTAGRIAVFGQPPSDVATKKRIGYLPEETYLYRFLNARETLDYYGRLFHQPRRQRMHRIDTLLEMVGLDAVARRPIGEYSKGMQRRIGLAQALINDPELLILDEPTTGLDPIGTRQIKDLIGELARRGKTILLCSHLLADVEDVCNRVAIMFGGKIRKQGTVDELLVRQGLTNIQVGSLSAEAIEEIERVLEKHGQHIGRIEQPRQKLENLFLDIVHEAQAAGLSTSGARAGGRIAEFLVGESAHLPESVLAENLIDELISRDGAASAEVAGGAPAPRVFQSSPALEPHHEPPVQPRPAIPASRAPAPPAPSAASAPPADAQVIEQLIAQAPSEPPTAAKKIEADAAHVEPPAIAKNVEPPAATNVERLLAEDDHPSVCADDVELPSWAHEPPREKPEEKAPSAQERRSSETDEKPDESFLSALIDVEAMNHDDTDDPKHGGRKTS
jgi:ABC-2 type transport system ATP-binding protein